MIKRFKVDFRNCLGCQACVLACKQYNQAKNGEGLRQVLEINANRDKQLPAYHLSFSCNHCREPKCLEVCKRSAIVKRDDGVVELIQEKCDLCRECIAACPYQAIRFNESKTRIIKCNMCEEGEGVPFCVEACPTGALSITDCGDSNDSEEVLKQVFQEISVRNRGSARER